VIALSNEYSPIWFATFLETIPAAQTAAEIAFLTRYLPQPAYRTVLDLCCGLGRHAQALAAGGYQVTGLDRDPAVIAVARRQSDKVLYLQGDMRDLAPIPGTFDAVVSLWQSFGYFDAATNADVLRQIYAKLRPGGRLILDIYHRAFFEQHQDERVAERDGRSIVERKFMTGDRLTVQLDYGAGESDTFEWQLYTPEDISALAEQMGYQVLRICSSFAEQTPATAASPRMQLVFQT
jgi:SAM-dependent methyltransferase